MPGGLSPVVLRLNLQSLLINESRFAAGANRADALPLEPSRPPVRPERLGHYPCALSEDADAALAQLAKDLVKAWGDRALTLLELEDDITQAAEKAPSDDRHIQALRDCIAPVKAV